MEDEGVMGGGGEGVSQVFNTMMQMASLEGRNHCEAALS